MPPGRRSNRIENYFTDVYIFLFLCLVVMWEFVSRFLGFKMYV